MVAQTSVETVLKITQLGPDPLTNPLISVCWNQKSLQQFQYLNHTKISKENWEIDKS